MNRNQLILLLVTLVAMATVPFLAQAQQIHLDLMDVLRDPIPSNGSQWHELFPNFCDVWTQDDYLDNGDGEVSPCDAINLVNAAGDVSGWHITWVGPTYYLVNTANPEDIGYLEPTEPQGGGDPTCETWVEIWPNNGMQWHIDGWEDNGTGVLDECDLVLIAGDWYHIEHIGLNITVEPGPISNELKSWGEIKSQYED